MLRLHATTYSPHKEHKASEQYSITIPRKKKVAMIKLPENGAVWGVGGRKGEGRGEGKEVKKRRRPKAKGMASIRAMLAQGELKGF